MKTSSIDLAQADPKLLKGKWSGKPSKIIWPQNDKTGEERKKISVATVSRAVKSGGKV